MNDRDLIADHDRYLQHAGSTEPDAELCECGSPADGPEDSGLCVECWLATVPVCVCCEDAPGTEDLGGGVFLCCDCEPAYHEGEWSPDEDDEVEPLPGDADEEFGCPVGKAGAQ